mmetsp:Transcript_68780/g.110853  ORF Transcript_68780/g.110853 Transcript_68780/m.110853 type:complete len:378 (-) Transcript_68780:62-1195(-)
MSRESRLPCGSRRRPLHSPCCMLLAVHVLCGTLLPAFSTTWLTAGRAPALHKAGDRQLLVRACTMAAVAKGRKKSEKQFAEVSAEKQKLFGILKGEQQAVWQFNKFCSEQGMPPRTRVPDISESMVQQFLDLHSKSTFEAVELATTEQIERMDKVRQDDAAAAWQWEVFCTEKAHGIDNPKRLPTQVVEEFLVGYKDGMLDKVEMTSDELALQVVEIQKAGGGKQWLDFCKDEVVGSNKNPGRLPAQVVRRFLSGYKAEVVEVSAKQAGEDDSKPAKTVSKRSKLSEAVSRRVKRKEPGNQDVIYETKSSAKEDESRGPFQSTVVLTEALHKRGGLEAFPLSFTGDLCATKIEAMESAADKALLAFLANAVAAAAES